MKIKPNSGGAIKGIADAIKWIGYIASFLLFILILVFFQRNLGPAFFVGLLVFGIGCLISWLSTRLLYGFGELVQYTAEAASYLEKLATGRQPNAASAVANSNLEIDSEFEAISDGVESSHTDNAASAVANSNLEIDSEFEAISDGVESSHTDNLDFQIEDNVLIKYVGSSDTAIIPYNVTAIGSYAFLNCSHLSSVFIPETVRTIRNGAFFCCANLTQVTLTMGVSAVDVCAFSECPNLTDVFIADSVVKIADFVFRDSPKVTIHAKRGSYAEKYANKHNLPFVFVAEGGELPT